MTFLAGERATLQAYLPGLDEGLVAAGLEALERPGNPGLKLFREAGGASLLVPREYGGLGASAVEAVRIQRAIGARSPSLAVATTMHHFSVASLVELTAQGNGFQWAMLEAIAGSRWLVSSGFAEGRSGQHILRPTMQGESLADGSLRVNGRKRPCSLTWSMDLLSASVAVTDPAGGPARLAIVLIPANSDGIERRPFWQTNILAGAESDEVECRDVIVPEALTYYPDDGPRMDRIQARGFAWFELLVSASYVGAASALAEQVIATGRGSSEERALLAVELESAAACLERTAIALTTVDDDDSDGQLFRALLARYAAERAVERAAMGAASLAGGMAFITSPSVGYLLATSRALAYHPPSRSAASESLARHLAGEPMRL